MDVLENGGEIETSSDDDSDEVKVQNQASNQVLMSNASEHIDLPIANERSKDLTVSMA
jgi:hypothetical protein